MKRPFISYLVLILVAFKAISAILVGFLLVMDIAGACLGYSLELLESTPFSNFLIPGLFLFIILGLFPAFIVYGLITKRNHKSVQKRNSYKKQHWSWISSHFLGLLLILWIHMQLFFGIEFHVLHFIYSILGILIVVVVHLPATKRHYNINL